MKSLAFSPPRDRLRTFVQAGIIFTAIFTAFFVDMMFSPTMGSAASIKCAAFNPNWAYYGYNDVVGNWYNGSPPASWGDRIGTLSWPADAGGSAGSVDSCTNDKVGSVTLNPGGGGAGVLAHTAYGQAFQCVELVARYYDSRYNSPYHWGDAYTDWSNHPSLLQQEANGITSIAPMPGDILVWDRNTSANDPQGHIGIIGAVNTTNQTITTLEQNFNYNGNDPSHEDAAERIFNYSVSGGVYTIHASIGDSFTAPGWGSGKINNTLYGWLHRADNTNNSGYSLISGTNAPPPPIQQTVPANIYAIDKVTTGSGMTEVHVLQGPGNFQQFSLHAPTTIGQTGSDKKFVFLVGPYMNDGQPDLWVIQRADTATNTTEIHVLSAASNYQQVLQASGTALGVTGTDSSWDFALGDNNGDGNLDLYIIKKANTNSKTTEVFALDGAHFNQMLMGTSTILPPTGSDDSWAFGVADYNGDGIPDLYAIKKANTDTNSTEVFVVNGANVNGGSFHQMLVATGTPLQTTGSDSSWVFGVADFNGDGKPDLYAIAKANTGSNTTEAHILDGSNNFQSFLLHTRTALQTTGTDNSWEFSVSPYKH